SRLSILIFIALLWLTESLNLMTYFGSLLISLLLFFILFMAKIPFPLTIKDKNSFKLVLGELYQGWRPISFYTLLTTLYSFGGRYAIQFTSGVTEQGSYTYALFLALLPLAILAPMTTIYMSHMSKLYSRGLHQILKNNF